MVAAPVARSCLAAPCDDNEAVAATWMGAVMADWPYADERGAVAALGVRAPGGAGGGSDGGCVGFSNTLRRTTYVSESTLRGGRMIPGWKDGRMAGRKDGRMAGWQEGRMLG